MKKLLAVALVLCMLALSGCTKFVIYQETDIFTKSSVRNATLEDIKTAFVNRYGEISQQTETSYTWLVDKYNFCGKEIESITIQFSENKINAIQYTFIPEAYSDSEDPYIAAIDKCLDWFQIIDKSLNTKGTVYHDGSVWNDPYYSFGTAGQANDANKLIMQLNIISGRSTLEWKSMERYVKTVFSADAYKAEAGITF